MSTITPAWYATKRETGKMVPTWNYATVHAWGRPRLIEDTRWLLRQLHKLTQHQEGTRSNPWRVSDAPRDMTVLVARYGKLEENA